MKHTFAVWIIYFILFIFFFFFSNIINNNIKLLTKIKRNKWLLEKKNLRIFKIGLLRLFDILAGKNVHLFSTNWI